MTAILPALALFTLAGLLYSEHVENPRLRWLFKPATSLLFVLTGLVAFTTDTYAWLILVGLVLGLVGDVCLIPKSQQWFLFGLVAFLLGHVAYTAAFFSLANLLTAPRLVIALIGLFAGVVLVGLWPRLGAFRLPVLAYLLVISLMVVGSLAVYTDEALPRTFRRAVGLGALAFYFSDLAVALDRFGRMAWKNAYWGLPLYYLGQFALALSIGLR
jgi:uncharacterized membrane protein YhhN